MCVPSALHVSSCSEYFAQLLATVRVSAFVLEMLDLLQPGNFSDQSLLYDDAHARYTNLRRGTNPEAITDQGVFHSLRR